jgi:signal transduction histidine kinase/ActR/RegA family two-component response regulator
MIMAITLPNRPTIQTGGGPGHSGPGATHRLSERRRRAQGLQELTRMIQALSRSNQAMARARDEASYLREVCRIIVEDCGCPMVWVGYKERDPAQSVRPVAWSGFEDGYLATLDLTWADRERGRGPTGTAIRTGRPCLCPDITSDPRFAPWRQEALTRGYRSSAAFPLLDGEETFGALMVYSSEPASFGDAQARVLEELAGDLANGILTLRLRESERRAQEALRESSERLSRLNDELEQRVQERTLDLVRANEHLTVRILEREQAQEALRRSEEELRHVQKMEAIGTLAGGVAHDFNNLLQVINGYAELALARLPEDSPVRASLDTIQSAGQRGAALTRQLLAFSRKQVLAPRNLDLNQLFREMERFFLRVLTENIRLVFDLEPGLGPVWADPGQMEQVIMNLVVNARDAMPGGGVLTLETRGREGKVAFTVRDTGVGMTPEVMARMFEPFYTTKGAGKGTGLGLSTALGIVEQSGGVLEAQSEPGRGTTIQVTLPRSAASALAERAAPALSPKGGDETILLVEDDEGVRRLVAEHLGAAGYQVLEAPGAEPALALLEAAGPVRLLLTDVVMPGPGGRELAGLARSRQPGLRVVFMSGYPDQKPGAGEPAWGEALFLPKPFDRNQLLGTVRSALDAVQALTDTFTGEPDISGSLTC